MQRASLVGWGCAAFLGIAAMVGCATGTTDDATDENTNLTETPDANTGDETSVKLPPPADSTDASADADASADSGKLDAGIDSGPTGDPCAATAACTASTDLGSVSGDENEDVETLQGTGSQWVKIHVSEDDNGVFANDEEITVALTAPAGEVFSFNLYLAGDTSSQNCNTITMASTATSATAASATMSWGESGTFSNDSDDSREVTIEVRHVSGTCSTAKWSLSVTGNP